MAIEELVNTVLNRTVKNVYLLEKSEGDNFCIVFKRVSTNPGRTLNHEKSIDRYRFQVDCYGTNFADSRGLADSVIGLMDMNNVDFKSCMLNNDLYTKELDLNSNIYRTVLEFFVWN